MVDLILKKLIALLSKGFINIKSVFSFKKTEKRKYQDSIHQEAKPVLSRVSQQITIQNDNIPEIHLHLYGSGAKRRVEGHIEKRNSKMLIVESIDINKLKTTIEKQFIKLLPLKNLKYSDSLFTTKMRNIEVKMKYRTLDGKCYEFSQQMIQQKRKDDLFNVSLGGTPSIRKLENGN